MYLSVVKAVLSRASQPELLEIQEKIIIVKMDKMAEFMDSGPIHSPPPRKSFPQLQMPLQHICGAFSPAKIPQTPDWHGGFLWESKTGISSIFCKSVIVRPGPGPLPCF